MLATRILRIEKLLQDVLHSQPTRGTELALMPSVGGMLLPRDTIHRGPRPQDGMFVAVEDTRLSERQSLRMSFARKLLQALASVGMPADSRSPALKAASSFALPYDSTSTFQSNIFLDRTQNVAFVRVEWLDSAGDLVLALAHFMAVLAVSPGDLSADMSPTVAAMLHRNLTTLASEFFKTYVSSAPPAPVAVAPAPQRTSMRIVSLADARAKSGGSSSRLLARASAQTLVAAAAAPPVGGAASSDFDMDGIQSRLQRYTSALRVLQGAPAPAVDAPAPRGAK